MLPLGVVHGSILGMVAHCEEYGSQSWRLGSSAVSLSELISAGVIASSASYSGSEFSYSDAGSSAVSLSESGTVGAWPSDLPWGKMHSGRQGHLRRRSPTLAQWV